MSVQKTDLMTCVFDLLQAAIFEPSLALMGRSALDHKISL